MKRAEFKVSTIAFGIIAVIAVVCAQLFYIPASSAVSNETKTEKQQSPGQDQTYVSIPSTTLPSSAHVELNRDVFFLSETFLQEYNAAEICTSIAVPVMKVFEILIGSFISPNAP